jgi:peptidoglycan L-alanyl-D-glutamate endopeptidase CwlK
MMYPFPEHVAPALVLLLGVLTFQFEAAVPGATIRPYQGHRTHAEQAAYFAQGRQPLDEVNRLRRKAGLAKIGPNANRWPITLAGPAESAHTKDPSPAADFIVICRGVESWSARTDCDQDGVSDYRELGLIGEGLGLVWGGRWRAFPDAGHLELP